ncbi:MAG: hypothetical protein ACLFUI_07600, partial [Halanaerobiales bacterium]
SPERFGLKINQNKFSEEESSLEGYIKRNGRPMANVLVCLGEDRDMGTLWEADYIAITDENGFYQFKGIPADRYKFVLNLSSLRIKNMVYQGKNRNIEIGEDTKIANVNLVPEVEILSPDKPVYMDTLEPLKVTWEPYPDAAYYKFFGGVVRDNGSWSTGIEGKIYDNTAYLEFPDHIVNSNNISIDQEGIAPASLLGYEQLPTTFFYGVEAFDKEDKLISRSVNSIINNRIEYPGKELSEADKLLADRKYDEAIEEYEKHLENNPEDLRVLRILNRIYSDGYNFEEEGRNIEKAYQYSKKTYQITGDISYLWQTISSTLKLKKLEETEELLNMYIADSSDIGGHVFLVKGKLSIYQGRISEAEEYLLKAVKDGSGIGLLTVLYLLEGENEKAAGVEDLVDDKDSIHYYYREWIDDTLQKIESDQLKQFYKKIKQNQIDEAEDFLPENESGIFYRTLLKVLNPDFEENAADMLLDGYKDLETREFKEIIKELGAETIRGLKFPVEFIDW